MIVAIFAFANSQNLTICGKGLKTPYKYALCAASTCTPTGQMIATNGGNPRSSVIEGMAISMPKQGSCAPPLVDGKIGVWSLFAPLLHYPQEANGFVQSPRSATKAVVQSCPGSLAMQSANCFSFSCSLGAIINGTQTAICKCPISQIANGTEFLIEAGQGNPAACGMYPVAAPDPFTSLFSQVYSLRETLAQV